MEREKLIAYYMKQAGGGVGRVHSSIGPVYSTSIHRQQGHGAGIGRILGRVAVTAASPYVAKGVQATAEEVTRAGMDLLNDIRTDRSLQNVTASTIARVKQAGTNIKKRAKRALIGRGKKSRAKGVKRSQKGGGRKNIKRGARGKKSQNRVGRGRTKTSHQKPAPDVFF